MNNHEASPPSDITPAAPDEFLDLESCFRPVAQQYGREMFALVYNAGMAGQAMQVIAAQAQKHGSRAGAHAAGVVAQAFNHVSSELAKVKGWSPELLAQCDRDIGLAFQGRIIKPGGAIILDA